MEPEQFTPFMARLLRSSVAVFVVAFHAHRKGCIVEIPPLRFAPTPEQAKAYASEANRRGDLFINKHRIEVKGLTCNFTCADDWPYADPIVSNAHTVAEHGNSVSAYVLVSADFHHMAVIRRESKAHWYEADQKVKNASYIERNCYCPMELVTFHPLTLLTELNQTNADNHL
jgi:hypothetical protein